MDISGSLLQWNLSLAETIGACATVSAIVLWFGKTFQSKEDAKDMNKRIEKVESELGQLKSGVNQIAVDVSFIRGALTVTKNKTP